MYHSHTMGYYVIIEEKEKRLYIQRQNYLQSVVLSEKARHETVCLHLFY